MIEHAYAYAEENWHVFPVEPRGKKPITQHGVMNATTEKEKISKWWSRVPDANIAVACGHVSGFFVLDVDVADGKQGLETLESLNINIKTLTSRTGSGGMHLFYKMPRDESIVIKNRTNFLPGLDVRSNNGYVVIPPSVHPSGNKYEWIRKVNPVKAPDKLIELIIPKKIAPWNKPTPLQKIDKNKKNQTLLLRASKYLAECPPAIQGSSGHNSLLYVANALVNGFELSKSETLSMLWNEFNPRCFPPWNRNKSSDVRDFERKVDEAIKTNKKNRGWLLNVDDTNVNDEQLIIKGQAIAEKLLANYNKQRYPDKEETKGKYVVKPKKVFLNDWDKITNADIREILKGTALEVIIQDLESVTEPCLPLTITLPKALVIAGAHLCYERNNAYTGYAVSNAVISPHLLQQGSIIKVRETPMQRARLKINTAHGQVCNIYALITAPSGAGKDIGGRVDALLHSSNLLLGDSGSAEGIADSLIEIPNGVLNISEFMNWVDPKHWQHKAASFLTSAFNKGKFNVILSKRKGESNRKADYCFPSIIANVQPGIIARKANKEIVESGFLQRFLITNVENTRQRPKTYIDSSLSEAAFDTLDCFRSKEGIVDCPEKYLDTLHQAFFNSNAPYRGHWERLINEYGPRFAVILSILAFDKNTEMQLVYDCWEKAELMIKWFYKQAVVVASTVVDDEHDAKFERLLKKLFTAIKANAMTKQEISKKYHSGTTEKIRIEAINELLQRGMIACNKEGKFFAIIEKWSDSINDEIG